MKILSISVAAYNVEKFIRQNLDSFVESGVLDEVEILVTDDGSKDTTPEIVAEYAARFPQSVILIRQENAGPGSTVNSGIRHATGKYFRMVDGDDWVNPTDFAKLTENLKKTDSDMILCDFTRVDDKTGEKRAEKLSLPFGEELSFAETAPSLHLSMHQVIYRTRLLQENKITLLNGFYTDMQYLMLPSVFVKTVTAFDLDVYQYRVSLDGQSMSYPSMQKNIRQHQAMLSSILALYEKYKSEKTAKEGILTFIRNTAVFLSGTQMGILLSFPPTPERKADFYDFCRELSQLSPDVYARFCKFRTARVLRWRAMYAPVSFLHRKKCGIPREG